VQVPQHCILLCPNHTGVGVPLAIMTQGAWETPLGKISLDVRLAENLKSRFSALEEDAAAHRAEHSAEVELPFLLSRQANLTFVPIALGTQHFEVLEQLGYAIADVVALESDEVLIVASSDMNHYESDAITRVKDHRALEKILALDARGLYDVVTQQSISMWGLSPAVVMLTAARKLGATSAELVKYATSGDVSGDRNMVVGYAGVVIR
jgi:AmmeMemoRadiSam system protein B